MIAITRVDGEREELRTMKRWLKRIGALMLAALLFASLGIGALAAGAGTYYSEEVAVVGAAAPAAAANNSLSNTIVFTRRTTIASNEDSISSGAENKVKYAIVLADENGNIIKKNGVDSTDLPAGSIVPTEDLTFFVGENGVLEITPTMFGTIQIPGYTFQDAVAYFWWSGNANLGQMQQVTQFKNFGRRSNRYSNYNSYLGFQTVNNGGNDYGGGAGNDYYAYNPTGTLRIVFRKVTQSNPYHVLFYNYGETGTDKIVDITTGVDPTWDDTKKTYGFTPVETSKTESDLTKPGDESIYDVTFEGWYTEKDATGNGTGERFVFDKTNKIFEDTTVYAKWKFTEKQVEIKYEAVGPEGETNFGSVTPTAETVAISTGVASGSIPTAETNFRFVGWYQDAACTTPVNEDWVDAYTDKIVPQKEAATAGATPLYKAATYYAKFERAVGNLKITKSGGAAGQTYIFNVTGGGKTFRVAVVGNNSVTIANLPLGVTYTVTEDEGWSWRYSASSASVELDAAEKEVTITNAKDKTQWLDDEDTVNNNFNAQ